MVTPVRTVRIPDALWDAAVRAAREQGTSVSAWVVAELTRRVRIAERREQG